MGGIGRRARRRARGPVDVGGLLDAVRGLAGHGRPAGARHPRRGHRPALTRRSPQARPAAGRLAHRRHPPVHRPQPGDHRRVVHDGRVLRAREQGTRQALAGGVAGRLGPDRGRRAMAGRHRRPGHRGDAGRRTPAAVAPRPAGGPGPGGHGGPAVLCVCQRAPLPHPLHDRARGGAVGLERCRRGEPAATPQGPGRRARRRRGPLGCLALGRDRADGARGPVGSPPTSRHAA